MTNIIRTLEEIEKEGFSQSYSERRFEDRTNNSAKHTCTKIKDKNIIHFLKKKTFCNF